VSSVKSGTIDTCLSSATAPLRSGLRITKFDWCSPSETMANRFELGHRAWPILRSAAARHETLTYGELAARLGYATAKVSRAALWPIQDYCLEKGLPPLTSIVLNRRTRRPGAGFIAWDGDIAEAHQRVFNYEWAREPVPFPPGTLLTMQGPARVKPAWIARQVFEVSDQETRVNGRGPYQDIFRKRLMALYAGSCALCDTRCAAFLVASHIVPWAQDSRNRLNPRNGILLCRTHDAGFEVGFVRIEPDLSITLRLRASRPLGRDLSEFLTRTSKRLRPPRRGYDPDPAFLRWRLDHLDTCEVRATQVLAPQ
jgi:hypothetical protein